MSIPFFDYSTIRDRLPGNAQVAAWRDRAIHALATHGLPSRTQEHWKYTDTRALLEQQFTPSNDAVATLPESAAEQLHNRFTIDAYRLVFINGRFHAPSSDTIEATGITVRNLHELLNSSPEELETTLVPANYDPAVISCSGFAALNAAMLEEGLLIHVAPGHSLDKPLHLQFVSIPTETQTIANPRLVIALGANARAQMVESHFAIGDTQHFANLVSDMQLAEGSWLEHIKLLESSDNDTHIASLRAAIGKDATYIQHNFCLGGKLARNDIHVDLNAPGANTQLNGLFMVDGERHIDNHLQVDHNAPHTHSVQQYRGVANNRGRGVLNSKVKVEKDAQQVVARQSSNNLLLAKLAEIDTKPELEIYADDVKCSHGATVGQLDDNMLFYLRSRGIAEDVARALLIFAFVDSIVAELPMLPIRRHLEQLLLHRLPDAERVREFV